MKLSDVLLGAILCISTPVIGTWTPVTGKLTPVTRKWSVGQKVHTQSGPVLGSAASKAAEVSVYLGIPYAEPPIGDLRFAASQPYFGNASIDGTKFGASCPVSDFFYGKPDTKGKNLSAAGLATVAHLSRNKNDSSEDCLTLNVWTKPQTGEKKKAVVIWVHGKGYTSGASSDPVYDGQLIADEEDIVLVTFNYRINIFGFPGNVNGTMNIGLLDQRLAIEWVRDNIDAFGGDPARMSLFGDSAGAGLVDLYSFAYVDNPIISGIALLSGSATLRGRNPDDKKIAECDWIQMTCELGCSSIEDNDPAEVLACMRNKTTAEITAAIPIDINPYGTKAFFPNVDDKHVFPDYYKRTVAGKYIQVPMLIGSTEDETSYHHTMANAFSVPQYNLNWAYESNSTYTCPASNRARAAAERGLPTWRYAYFGDFKSSRLTTAAHGRAYHGSDVLLVFGTALVPGVKPDADEIRLAKYARGAFGAFARDPKAGLKKYGWPLYDNDTKSLVQLGLKNKVGAFAVNRKMYDRFCPY
ncbi:hypothetical protein V493_02478 [Pseudogymnoascus sp. VKM F-4281 (FW-2241)]|nr:hypothetical protein V493_02478 [Pseudogymnoascus sp. VKM F-4281 (FW-2241)]